MTTLRPLIPLIALVAGLNLLLTDRFHQRILIVTLVWAVAAMSWNLTAKAGQISLGHSAFTGIGAYTFALAYVYLGWSPWLGMVAGMLLAAAAAVLIGLPSFKLEGFYFTLATIAYPLILMLLVVYAGVAELTVPYRPESEWFAMQFRDQRTWVWILLAMLALVLIGQHAIDRSRFGYYLRAIRDNQTLAEAVGIRSSRWKLGAFAISASIAAAVAVIWVNAVLFVVTAEQVFGLLVVIQMLSFVFVGGIASLWGPVVGAALLVPLGMVLSEQVGDRFPGTESLLYGLALVTVALVSPEGIVWRAKAALQRRRSDDRSPAPETDAAPAGDAAPVSTTAATVVAQSPASDGVPARPVLAEVRGVTKRFAGLTALTDVDLDFAEGTMVGIIGPNGAGKTTLFNVLTGFVRCDEGRVTFAGQDLTDARPPDRYVAGISRTFQVPQGFHRMTASENVLVAAFGAGLGDAESATADALDEVGLADVADRELSSLSTLEIKLLEIARAIVSRPRLLLVDEPLAGLNTTERGDLLSLLRRLGRERTMTVVVIEHSVRSLVRSVDHLIAFHEGALLTQGPPAEVVADPRVVRAYLGRRWNTDASDQQPARLV